MNTKIKKIFIFGIMLSLIVLNNAFVYASSFKFDAKAEKEIYKPGEEVYVDMNISEINVGETDDEFDIKYGFKDVDGNVYYLYVVEAEDFYFSIK